MAARASAGVSFRRHLADLIRHDGPLRMDHFMALANAHYYGTRDPLGAAGDFTTAPEISQLFGELIGLCLVDFWERSGAPSRIRLVELGPGRGTLMADILRAARLRPAFLGAADITLVETSRVLRARQADTLRNHAPRLSWAESFDAVPDDAPLFLIANEFFDALPIRQFVHRNATWHERGIGIGADGSLAFALMPAGGDLPIRGDSPEGHVFELAEAGPRNANAIGLRLHASGGIALVTDYGHAASGFGDTLQAVKAHDFADPLADPSEADLTAHVDFEALRIAAEATAYGPIEQGDFLRALGIEARAAALAKARPDQARVLAAALERLTAPDQMGTLFKAMALTGRGAPVPAGFGP